ncbi:glycosyltransferase [Lactobacillus sp. YT155]|uniref:glycosyltransferase n=1 Tax=Lactobacillus sp. YT155 TaxID=3060955 RepID=UPI00265E073A|nr:glycosyltransferase [Lactobacillus sp. YT155]MDO1605238.1 glycosyltransferase [Lactobacillus sp. YT155]
MNKHDISFVIPVYNTDLEILKTGFDRLSSFGRDSYEFLIVNDGSNEDVSKLCIDFCKDEKRAKYLPQSNAGVSVARNNGIANANGKWLFFLDPDDLLVTDFNTKITDEILKSKEDIIFLGFNRINEDEKIQQTFERKDIVDSTVGAFKITHIVRAILYGDQKKDGYYGYYFGTPWAKLINKQFILRNGLEYVPGIVKRQDAIFMIQTLMKQPSLKFVDEVVYNYRIDHENSISNRYNKKITATFEKISSILSESLPIELKKDLNHYVLLLSIELLFADFCNLNNQKSYQERQTDFLNYLDDSAVKQNVESAKLTNMPTKQKILGYLIKHRQFKLLNYLLYKRKQD